MQIKSVTVGLSMTESLPGYNNVKPSLTVTAEPEAGEEGRAVLIELDLWVTEYVQGKVDDALEQAGESPKYHRDWLHRLAWWAQYEAYFVLPADTELDDLPGDWRWTSNPMREMAVWHFAESVYSNRLTMGWTRVLIDEWWEKAELYRKHVLYVWRDSEYGPCEVRDKWVFVADGLAVPEGLHLIRDYSRRLETWLGEMGEDEEYLVVKNQAELDELAAEWAAAQPEQREKKVVREYESL